MGLDFNVSQLLKSDVGGTRLYEFVTDEPLDLDDSVASNIEGSVKFTLTNFGILADVRAHATLHLVCARCLEPFATDVNVAFEEEYRPAIDISTGLPIPAPDSDTAFTIPQNHTIDLREALRQNLLLSIDLIPLHDPDCKGLCPTCGANRNTDPCDCPSEELATPFAVLQGLLSQTDNTE